MTKLQSFALAMVLFAIGVVAISQVISIARFYKIIALEGLGAVSILAALIFFAFSFRGRD